MPVLGELDSNAAHTDISSLKELSAFIHRSADDGSDAEREHTLLLSLVMHAWRGLAQPDVSTQRARVHAVHQAQLGVFAAWKGETAAAKLRHKTAVQQLRSLRLRLAMQAWRCAVLDQKAAAVEAEMLFVRRRRALVLYHWKLISAETAVRRAQAVAMLQRVRCTPLLADGVFALRLNAEGRRANDITAQTQRRRQLLNRAMRAWVHVSRRAAWLRHAEQTVEVHATRLHLKHAFVAWRDDYLPAAMAKRGLQERARIWRMQQLSQKALKGWTQCAQASSTQMRAARALLSQRRVSACLHAWRCVCIGEKRLMEQRRAARAFIQWRALCAGVAAKRQATDGMTKRIATAAVLPLAPPLTEEETRRLEAVILAHERLVAEHAQCCAAAAALAHTPQAGSLVARCAHLEEKKREHAVLVRAAAKRLQGVMT
jgi:hypothetical protein